MPEPRPSPPELTPPGSTAQAADTPAGRPWVWIALTLLLLLGAGVIFLLPPLLEQMAKTPAPATIIPDAPAPLTPEPAPPADTIPQAPEPAPTDTAAARSAAEQELQAWLGTAARLQRAGAPNWAPPEWEQAQRLADQGDHRFTQRQFTEAKASYAEGRVLLEALEASRDERLAQALASGHAALEAGDAEAAVADFELALMIEPGHPEATKGLARAQVRDQLLSLMQSAEAAEANNDLPSALTDYQQASRLDPDYPAAGEGLERIAERMRDAIFQSAMSQALADLDAGRLEQAANALDKAAQVRPQAPVLVDARQRLTQARHQARVQQLQRRAADLAAGEQWGAAATGYQQLLALAPNAAAAKRGLAKAQARQQLHQQLDGYLARPDRLYAKGPRAHAQALLANTTPGAEPKLSAKLESLRQAIARGSQPTPVLLLSDGHTQVSIQRVGPQGSFKERRIELSPGSYTAVGIRDGYRDVRRTFVIQPGKPPPAPIRVQCEEAI